MNRQADFIYRIQFGSRNIALRLHTVSAIGFLPGGYFTGGENVSG